MYAVNKLLWWILAGSAGGLNRGRILEQLFKRPQNAHELAQLLVLDYKTIRYHLRVLEKNRLIISIGSEYGKNYFPSVLLEENQAYFDEIWNKIGKKHKKGKG